MSTKKLLLQITGLALAVWLLAGCGSPRTEPTMPTPIHPPTTAATVSAESQSTIDFAGHWEDTTFAFSLDLSQNGDHLQGRRVAVAQQGNRIDSLDKSIEGSIQGNTAIIRFQSSYTTNTGVAQITFIDKNTISWKVTTLPSGECYLPNETTLVRKALAAIQTPAAAPTQPQANPNATRIQFQPKATSWQAPGTLAPNTSIRFVLSALKGQPMTVELTTKPDSGAGPSAFVYIWGADGKVYTPDFATRYKGVLTVSQDYYIEVRSLSRQSITYTLLVAIPAVGSTPYVPVTSAVCQTLREMATQAIPATFTLEASAPFTDPITGETGQGCNLTVKGTGRDFSDPGQVTAKLVKGFLGFTEQIAYQADGPTGAATTVTRDMGLVLISAQWMPAPTVQCPSDKPISSCDLKPEQKLYTIKIQAAMK